MPDAKSEILKLLKKTTSLKSSDLTQTLGVSRQTVAKHLKQLVEANKITKIGSTRGSTYSLNTKKKKLILTEVKLIKSLQGLEEHLVYKELELRLSLNKHLNKNAQSIGFYAFGEMLNNAIDHSKSSKVEIHAQIIKSKFEFYIKDYGIGVFHNIQQYYKLSNEFDAVTWLLSGKKTTMPSKHSGEGLFFTSKISDYFSLKSHKAQLNFDNVRKDTSLSDVKNTKGTEVFFSIKCQTKKKLEDIFKDYTSDDFNFDKSKSIVKIGSGNSAVSRSQARKLLASLGEFDRIVLDMSGVEEIGQAFCDEIFRIYKERYPNKLVSWINTSPAVDFMIQRAIQTVKPRNLKNNVWHLNCST